MNLFMHKCAQILLMLFVFQTLVLITSSATFYSKVDIEVSDPSIKCGECPCSNTCGQPLPILSPPPPPPSPPPPPPSPPPPPPPQNCDQLPRQPPPPPPPRFVYVTGLPPPPRFVYMSGSPRNVNPANPFNLRVYSKAAHSSFKTAIMVLYVYATFQVLVFW